MRLAGAPAGTYTAELLAGNVDPLLGDNADIHRFLLTVADHADRLRRPSTGCSSWAPSIELIGGVLDWFQTGGVFPLPPVRALVSQGDIDSFDGATSEIAQAGDVSAPPP